MGKNIFETLMGAIVLVVAAGFVSIAYKSGNVSSTDGYFLSAKFDRVDGLNIGSDVRISGIKVGSVVEQIVDPETYSAIIKVAIEDKYKLPKDSSAEISSESLLGGKYLSIVPGGDDKMLENGGEIQFTQSSVNLEQLLGKFVFGSADEKQKNEGEAADNVEDIF